MVLRSDKICLSVSVPHSKTPLLSSTHVPCCWAGVSQKTRRDRTMGRLVLLTGAQAGRSPYLLAPLPEKGMTPGFLLSGKGPSGHLRVWTSLGAWLGTGVMLQSNRAATLEARGSHPLPSSGLCPLSVQPPHKGVCMYWGMLSLKTIQKNLKEKRKTCVKTAYWTRHETIR